MYKVITDLAAKDSCVIVGRCADYILQDTADCLKVFIHADMAFRAKRIVEVYGEREQSPEERLRDKDKCRAACHRFYTNMKWGHAQNYHLTLDSGVLASTSAWTSSRSCTEKLSGKEQRPRSQNEHKKHFSDKFVWWKLSFSRRIMVVQTRRWSVCWQRI